MISTQLAATVALAITVALAAACATTSKPCQNAGDTTWDWGPKYAQTPFKGNKQCLQTQDPKTGKWTNNGRYVAWHPNGKVALEGAFKDGLKEGKWVQFDEEGKKVVEREYAAGVLR